MMRMMKMVYELWRGRGFYIVLDEVARFSCKEGRREEDTKDLLVGTFTMTPAIAVQ